MRRERGREICKKGISLLAAGVLFLGMIPYTPADISYAAESVGGKETEKETGNLYGETVKDEDGFAYVEGEVLVTVAAPEQEQTFFSEKGRISKEEDLTVADAWDFGTAEVLGTTTQQCHYLENKELYVARVTSESYSTKELVEKMNQTAYVVSAMPNYIQNLQSVTKDTYSDSQWYLTGSETKNGKGIQYTKTVKNGDMPIVAVVDTGINYNHEDLKEHMWVNPYSTLPGVCGYDFGDMDDDPMDTDGHGSHCAGIIGAVTDNDTGIAGVAEDVQIMALRVVNARGNVENSSIVAAFNYIYKAQEEGANIKAVNCSWGGGNAGPEMSAIMKKIGEKGALFIFASGNDGKNTDAESTESLGTPYNLDSKYIVKAGASNMADEAADFSNYGKTTVDIFTPGDSIYSTVIDEVFQPVAYSEEKREKLTRLFDDGMAGTASLYTPTQLGVTVGSIRYSEAVKSSCGSYDDRNTGSYFVGFKSNYGKADASIYLDTDALSISPNETVYISCDTAVAVSGETEDDLSWSHFQRKNSSSDYVTVEGKQYMRLITLTNVASKTIGLYLDNIAISVDNPDTSEFGCYDYMSGTSMAAPVASGGVAVLAGMFPGESAIQLKERLLTSVRKEASLTDKCVTGGIMDMSLFASSTCSTPATDTDDNGSQISDFVSVTKVKLNKTTATLCYGKKLRLKATVTPSDASNKKIKWSVSNSKYAKVTSNGVVIAKKKGIGKKIKVTAKAKDGSGKKAVCTVKIKKS